MATEYQINYFTHNHYEAPVTEALFEFVVAPCKNKTQAITSIGFTNSLGADVFFYKNLFGFQVARVRSTKPFQDFQFTMNAVVEKTDVIVKEYDSFSLAEERTIYTSREFYVDYHLYLEITKYTTVQSDLSYLNKDPDQSIYYYLRDLNTAVHNLLGFDPDPTDVHTTAGEALALGKGVCQDYSHLFLSIARRNGIPCRYVSGYLNQGAILLGAAVMHAWVEAYIPGMGWCGFDPTNNLLADHNHIKAAHGIDYSDCSPIKGVLKTSGKNQTAYEVKVIQNLLEAEAQ
ncbi:transglutaminase domain-containing protein [Adhaeribacter aquaticus]|uniref:transglutaminase domain-containing protein n=1 Tax=Adhaeribacter aquaticus TaxID=299567 RepID=UPI0003FDA500|nr:transglutaminase family protein [Adhaeribacter aquaticus]